MRTRIIIGLALLILVSSSLTYKAFAYYRTINQPPTPTTTITLILPDQEYSLTTAELADLESELVIPIAKNPIPRTSYNTSRGTVQYINPPQEYVINLDNLNSDTRVLGDESSISFVPPYVIRNIQDKNLSAYNRQLHNIHSRPITVSIKNGREFSDITLASTVLRQLINPTTIDSSIPPEIDKPILISYITSRLTAKQKQFFSPQAAYENAQRAINYRFMGDSTNSVILGVDDGPSSRGELPDRYLEVDLSQQKMYFFINSNLYKEYHISTGNDYPTPVGEYHILNKAPKAFSDIYNVWMPYWMGFTYANDVGAYLGLHEIAYAVDDFGKPFYRYGYYIGDTMTGGCIAMEPKDSKEIYDLTVVGMLIRVVR